jgi:hypothetical protein
MTESPETVRVWVFTDIHWKVKPQFRQQLNRRGTAKALTPTDITTRMNRPIGQFIDDSIKAKESPDVIVVLGDVSEVPTLADLAAGLDYLLAIQDLFPNKPSLVAIPGNHDLRLDTPASPEGTPTVDRIEVRQFYDECEKRGFVTPRTPEKWPKIGGALFVPIDSTAMVGSRLSAGVSGFGWAQSWLESGSWFSRQAAKAVGYKPLLGAYFAPGAILGSSADEIEKALKKIDPARTALRIGLMHQPITKHASATMPDDSVEIFIASGFIRQWLLSMGFGMMLCGHDHEFGLTIERSPAKENFALPRDITLCNGPCHQQPDYPILVGTLVVGGHSHHAAMTLQVARVLSGEYKKDQGTKPLMLQPSSTPVWQRTARRVVMLDARGEARHYYYFEGLSWSGTHSPVVRSDEPKSNAINVALGQRYRRGASIRFDYSHDQGVVVEKPIPLVVGTREGKAAMLYLDGAPFEEQAPERLNGFIGVGCNTDEPVDIVMPFKSVNSFATTREEHRWLHGVSTAPGKPDARERVSHRVLRYCERLEFIVQFRTGCPAPATVSQVYCRSEDDKDPFVSARARVLKFDLPSQDRDESPGALAVAVVERPVPGVNYLIEWDLPETRLSKEELVCSNVAEAVRRKPLRARRMCRAKAANPLLPLQGDEERITSWLKGMLRWWQSMTGIEAADMLDVSLATPVLPINQSTGFEKELLASWMVGHKKIEADLQAYKVPPLRLVITAGNFSDEPFWDEFYMNYGEGLAGHAFRRRAPFYMHGHGVDEVRRRIYKPLPSGVREHHSLVVVPFGPAGLPPAAILSLGVRDHDDPSEVAASRLASMISDEPRLRAFVRQVDKECDDLCKVLMQADLPTSWRSPSESAGTPIAL